MNGAGMAHWWERSPPINMTRVRILPVAKCRLSLYLFSSLLRGFFFSRFSGFPPSTKTDISKFQFDQDRGAAWTPAKAIVASSLNIVNVFIYFSNARVSLLPWFALQSDKTVGHPSDLGEEIPSPCQHQPRTWMTQFLTKYQEKNIEITPQLSGISILFRVESERNVQTINVQM